MIIIFRHFFSQNANSIVYQSFVNKLIDFSSFDDPLQLLYQSIHHHPVLRVRHRSAKLVQHSYWYHFIVVTISPSRIYKQLTFASFTILDRVFNSHSSRTSLPRRSTNYIWLDSIQQQHLLWQCPLHQEDSTTWIL